MDFLGASLMYGTGRLVVFADSTGNICLVGRGISPATYPRRMTYATIASAGNNPAIT